MKAMTTVATPAQLPLTDADVASFERNGFLAIERIADGETVARLGQLYDAVLRKEIDLGEHDRPLDDVDLENGCMQFVPGAHREVRQHYVASGDPTDQGRLLATDDFDTDEVVACPLPAGGCTIHTEGTLHFTGPNTSAARTRRAYIFMLRRVGV